MILFYLEAVLISGLILYIVAGIAEVVKSNFDYNI